MIMRVFARVTFQCRKKFAICVTADFHLNTEFPLKNGF
jgi:hypothetical protein